MIDSHFQGRREAAADDRIVLTGADGGPGDAGVSGVPFSFPFLIPA